MEPHQVLEALVAVAATLGEVAATVTGQDGDMLLVGPRESLRAALRTFTWHLCCTLNPRGVISLGLSDVTSLRQALSPLGAKPGAPSARARVTAAASAWQGPVAALMESWERLAGEATKLYEDWGNTSTWKGQWEPGPRLLRCLATACDKGTALPWALLCRLGDIEAALQETRVGSRDVPDALVIAVNEAERLWEASTRLTTCHLLGTLRDIHRLLSRPYGGSSGSRGRVVAERCQRALEDIPRLLRGQ